ncbi:alanine dehydrogenase [soil metagenome]|nr:alanine dehydrogenase [Actinomycetota bacterium]MDQ3531904.1 alanine dehydrogenase [Actinomycetota bacterium]
MKVGVPKEVKDNEYRVAITPSGVRELVVDDHQVLIERSAGSGSSISDEQYERAGATIVADADRVFADADMVLKVKEPMPEEFHRLREGLVLFTYLHLAAAKDVTEALLEAGTTAVAYETVELADGFLPLLAPMSEVAGRMAPHVGAHYLERGNGGLGVLMGGVSGVRPARVVIIGAGMAGMNAAWIAQGMEAEVVVLDNNINKLRDIDQIHKGRILTIASNRLSVEEAVVSADLVIGAVLVPGALAPKVVTEDIVKEMRPGSVAVDIAIDQGGSFETSTVTTHSDPTFMMHDVVHYCVGNMPGAVPHTSTYALTNATLPYVSALAGRGFVGAVKQDPALAEGVNAHRGSLTYAPVAEAHGLESISLDELL